MDSKELQRVDQAKYPTVAFRLPGPEQRKALEKAAAARNVTLSTYCRSVVLGSVGAVEPGTTEARVLASLKT